MYNQNYGLEEAVIEGRKTMTRREESFLRKLTYTYGQQGMGTRIEVLPCGEVRHYRKDCDSFIVIGKSRFHVGEVVAVAQSYKDLGCKQWINGDHIGISVNYARNLSGWTNKMYVKAELMPVRHICTDIKIERLQDISDEDCLKEGIIKNESGFPDVYYFFDNKQSLWNGFPSARKAFAVLIDKVSGKGTWERNPWVVAYTFQLVK